MRARREGRMTGVDESKMRTRTTPREILVPGDWVVECGDGTCRVVPDPEAG